MVALTFFYLFYHFVLTRRFHVKNYDDSIYIEIMQQQESKS